MNRGALNKRGCLVAVSAAAMLVSSVSPAYASGQEDRYDFDIDAETLGGALEAIVQRTNARLIFPEELAAEGGVNPVNGAYTLEEALAALLKGTDFSGGLTKGGVIVISLNQDREEAPMTSGTLKKSLLASVGVLMFGAAHAQDVERVEDDKKEEVENVTVTGTRLKGIAPESAPVIVFDREDIDKSGLTSVQEFIKIIPQNSGQGVGEESFLGNKQSGFGDQGGSLNLRGLGNRATLTLLNGNRMAPSGDTGQAIDISLIPLSAVERVEMLTVGASAIYGSDAVGGVVNFILRDDFEGFETTLKAGTAVEGNGTEFEFSQAVGTSWTGGNAMLNYQYRDQNEIRVKDRRHLFSGFEDEDYFTPATESHSVFGTFKQQMSDRVSLGFSGFFSDRESQRDVVSNTDGQVNQAANARAYSIAADIRYDLGNNWEAKLAGSLARNDSLVNSVSDINGSLTVFEAEGNVRGASLSFAGDVFELPGGAVSVALGGQYNYQRRGSEVTTRFLQSPFQSNDLSSNAAFFEVLAPFVSESNRIFGIERLEFNAALRYEDYGGSIGDTVDPMLGLLWAPVPALAVRATYDTSFRAPLPLESSGEHSLLTYGDAEFIFADPTNDPERGGFPLFIFGFDPDLTPEQAETYTIGADYNSKKFDGLRFSATYFNTSYKDKISIPFSFVDHDGLIGNPAFEPFFDREPDISVLEGLFVKSTTFGDFRNFFESNPTPSDLTASDITLLIDSRVTNTAATKMDGLDFSGGFRLALDQHDFDFSANATYLLSFDEMPSPAAIEINRLDTVQYPVNIKGRAGASWSHEGVTANLFFNYTDGYNDVRFTPNERVSSHTTIDFTSSYDFDATSRVGLFSDTVLSLTVLNVFDKKPPFVTPTAFDGILFDPTNASGRGRFVSFTVRKKW